MDEEQLPHLREKLGKLLVQVFQRRGVAGEDDSVLHYYQVFYTFLYCQMY